MLVIDLSSKDEAPTFKNLYHWSNVLRQSQISWTSMLLTPPPNPGWHKPWPQIRCSRRRMGRPQISFHERNSFPAVKYRLLLQSDQRMGLIPLNIMNEHKKRSAESLIEWREITSTMSRHPSEARLGGRVTVHSLSPLGTLRFSMKIRGYM